jgi:protein-disulfide isomerase
MQQKQSTRLIVALGLMLTASLGLWSEATFVFAEADPNDKTEVQALRHDLERLQVELEGVKKALERIGQRLSQRPADPSDVVAQVSIAGNPTLGSRDAPLTLIEFSDYQCSHCARFAQTTLPALKAEYVDTGKVRYVFRDFPLDRIHLQARKAAEAAHCAGDQGHYWAMHQLLFQHQQALQAEQLQAYARSLNLDPIAFEECLEQGKYTAEVQQDYDDGIAAGVRGTPGFFLGKTRPDETIQGTFLQGARPITAFQQIIDRLLSKQ